MLRRSMRFDPATRFVKPPATPTILPSTHTGTPSPMPNTLHAETQTAARRYRILQGFAGAPEVKRARHLPIRNLHRTHLRVVEVQQHHGLERRSLAASVPPAAMRCPLTRQRNTPRSIVENKYSSNRPTRRPGFGEDVDCQVDQTASAERRFHPMRVQGVCRRGPSASRVATLSLCALRPSDRHHAVFGSLVRNPALTHALRCRRVELHALFKEELFARSRRPPEAQARTACARGR